MSMQPIDPYCARLIEKKLTGQSLDAAEKEHFGEREICIAEILQRLAQAAEGAASAAK